MKRCSKKLTEKYYFSLLAAILYSKNVYISIINIYRLSIDFDDDCARISTHYQALPGIRQWSYLRNSTWPGCYGEFLNECEGFAGAGKLYDSRGSWRLKEDSESVYVVHVFLHRPSCEPRDQHWIYKISCGTNTETQMVLVCCVSFHVLSGTFEVSGPLQQS